MSGKGKHLELIGREKNKLLLRCDEITDGKDNQVHIDAIDKYILGMIEVPDFNGFGADKQHDKDFEALCAHLQKQTPRNVKELTTMEFHSLLLNVYKSRPKSKSTAKK